MKTWSLIVLGLLAVASGCSDGSPYAKVRVSGSVAYEDGEPIPVDQIQLRFDSMAPPINEATHPRPGMATAGPDGRFEVVTTDKYNDGLISGKHKVKLSARDANGRQLVPELYTGSESPLVIDTAVKEIKIRVPRP